MMQSLNNDVNPHPNANINTGDEIDVKVVA
jgi:hypothetical protein